MDQKHNCYKISFQGTKSVKTKLLTLKKNFKHSFSPTTGIELKVQLFTGEVKSNKFYLDCQFKTYQKLICTSAPYGLFSISSVYQPYNLHFLLQLISHSSHSKYKTCVKMFLP